MRFPKGVIYLVPFMSMLILSGCGQYQSSSGVATKSGNEAAVSSNLTVRLAPYSGHGINIKDANLQNGWAYGFRNGRVEILKSLGEQWYTASLPYKLPTQSKINTDTGSVLLNSINSKTAFFAWTSGNSLSFIRTVDGGHTWSISHLRLPSMGTTVSQLDFINEDDGWMVVQSEGGFGQSIKWLYHTRNGGATWTQEVDGIKYTPIDIGYDFKLTFTNMNDGWWICENTVSSSIALYRTTDAGRVWNPVHIKFPNEVKDGVTGHIIATNFKSPDPEFIIQLVSLKNGQNMVTPCLYKEKADGTWSANILSQFTMPDGSPDQVLWGTFVPKSMTGWLVAGKKLYRSTAAGNTWTIQSESPSTVLNGDVQKLEFYSSQVGELLMKSADNLTTLYETTNGGFTWIPVS